MKKMRILSVILACLLLVPLLIACGDKPEDTEKTESTTQDGTAKPDVPKEHWAESVDFQGEDLVVNVSVNVNTEQTFRSADIFTRGPDSLSEDSDAVEKMIFNRNKQVAEKLNVKLVWQETDKGVGGSLEEIKKIVQGDAEDTPDIFINDMYDEIHAMMVGCLWNLLDAKDSKGNAIPDYFDFSSEGWLYDFMRGTTVDQSKMYIAVSDYFLDVIRYSFVIYVNRGLFEENLANFFGDASYLYEQVLDGNWDYEMMRSCIEQGHRDTHDPFGEMDKDDEVIGFAANPLLQRTFVFSSGLSVVTWEDGKMYNGKPSFVMEHPQMKKLSDNFSKLYNQKGVYYQDLPRETNEIFINGNALFAISMLGEMESEAVRESSVNKGVLPVPKYDRELQKDYYTVVHDQAELGCILNNARHFSAASAYLQLNTEKSVPILKEYYEKSLKLKYNDDKDAKAMIDHIHDRIVDPFESVISRMVVCPQGFLPGAPYTPGMEVYNIVFDNAKDQKDAFVSGYDKHKAGWAQNLAQLVTVFEGLE